MLQISGLLVSNPRAWQISTVAACSWQPVGQGCSAGHGLCCTQCFCQAQSTTASCSALAGSLNWSVHSHLSLPCLTAECLSRRAYQQGGSRGAATLDRLAADHALGGAAPRGGTGTVPDSLRHRGPMTNPTPAEGMFLDDDKM